MNMFRSSYYYPPHIPFERIFELIFFEARFHTIEIWFIQLVSLIRFDKDLIYLDLEEGKKINSQWHNYKAIDKPHMV